MKQRKDEDKARSKAKESADKPRQKDLKPKPAKAQDVKGGLRYSDRRLKHSVRPL